MDPTGANRSKIHATEIIYPETTFSDYDGLKWRKNAIFKYDPSRMYSDFTGVDRRNRALYYKGKAQPGCLLCGPFLSFDNPGVIFSRIEIASKIAPSRYRVCTRKDTTGRCMEWKFSEHPYGYRIELTAARGREVITFLDITTDKLERGWLDLPGKYIDQGIKEVELRVCNLMGGGLFNIRIHNVELHHDTPLYE